MERTKQKTINGEVLAILTGDWHLREDQPVCRTDNFWESQWDKVRYVYGLQQKYNVPVIHSGDLFHHWKPSPYLLAKCMIELPKQFMTVYGNHDLPNHSMDLKEKSGIFCLQVADRIQVLRTGHWGVEPEKNITLEWPNYGKTILVWHVMVYQGKEPWPGCTAPTAAKLLRKYPEPDIILTGDNHKPFVETFGDRVLLNPGCLTRQRSSETHRPAVWLYLENNEVVPVYLPVKEGVITREHLEKVEERDARIDAFVSKLHDAEYETSVSFADNLKQFEQSNPVDPEVMKIVYDSIDRHE